VNLIKEDYQNVLKLLDRVTIQGKEEAKYIALLAHKLEQRVVNWFDGHFSGYKPEPVAPPAAPAAPVAAPVATVESGAKAE
jgi:hypothetical protein